MTVLSVRRWLGVAWLTYLFITMLLFAIISMAFFVWFSWFGHAQTGSPILPLIFYPLAFLLAQLCTALVVSWFAGKAVLKPLMAMSQAARQIAQGDLNFSLPLSQVREVAEVAKAFEEMGNALQQALNRQAAVEQERRLFISAIAHDLCTPLFSLRGYLEGLEKGLATTPQKAAHYMKICREKAALLEKRVSNLFAYARLEYLSQAPHWERLDLNSLLGEIVAGFRAQAALKQIKLELVNTDQPLYIVGDTQLLGRVFENLLDNALRYTPENGTIKVSWDRAADKVHFEVEDSGTGIAATDLPHLFEPLYQGKPTLNQQRGGAGLGLTIAQRILEAHQGGLAAANRQNGGALFTGWLKAESRD